MQISQSITMQKSTRDSIFYADVIYRQSEFVYQMDHNSGGTNWGTDDGTQEVTYYLMEQTQLTNAEVNFY